MESTIVSPGSLEKLSEDASGRPVGDVLAELAGALRSASKVLIATHVSPDGDAIGSSTALALGLRNNTALTYLYLEGNNIGDAACTAVRG